MKLFTILVLITLISSNICTLFEYPMTKNFTNQIETDLIQAFGKLEKDLSIFKKIKKQNQNLTTSDNDLNVMIKNYNHILGYFEKNEKENNQTRSPKKSIPFTEKKETFLKYQNFIKNVLKMELESNKYRKIIMKKIKSTVNSKKSWYYKVCRIARLKKSIRKLKYANQRILSVKEGVLSILKQKSINTLSDLFQMIGLKKDELLNTQKKFDNIRKVIKMAHEIKNDKNSLNMLKKKILVNIKKLEKKEDDLEIERLKKELNYHFGLIKTRKTQQNNKTNNETYPNLENVQIIHKQQIEESLKNNEMEKTIVNGKEDKIEHIDKSKNANFENNIKLNNKVESLDIKNNTEQQVDDTIKDQKQLNLEENKSELNDHFNSNDSITSNLSNPKPMENKVLKKTYKIKKSETRIKNIEKVSKIRSQIINYLTNSKIRHENLKEAKSILMKKTKEKEKILDKINSNKKKMEKLKELEKFSKSRLFKMKKIKNSNNKTEKQLENKPKISNGEKDSEIQGRCKCKKQKSIFNINNEDKIKNFLILYKNLNTGKINNYIINEILQQLLHLKETKLNKDKIKRMKIILDFYKK
jgi:hypothetical protein